MDKIKIRGGQPLKGSIAISGSKNAALPIMASSILSREELILHNVPLLEDIKTMRDLLVSIGVTIDDQLDPTSIPSNFSRTMRFNPLQITQLVAEYDIVRKMRASVLVLGPLLAREREAKVSLPGGCAIGTRPIDLHLKALEQMGAEITLDSGYISAAAPNGLKGADIHFEKVSVGATENILMAASLAEGTTTLHNAAKEPEISDLAHCLNARGAKITGIGTPTLTIEGVKELRGGEHSVIPDRIEAGSFAIAAAITRGEVLLTHLNPHHMHQTLQTLKEMGVTIEEKEDSIRVSGENSAFQPISVSTAPYPGLATDMQAQLMSLMTQANGASHISETIFENRYMHVPELTRMGADVQVHGNEAVVHGPKDLRGAEVMATDLRASFSLILAALIANGETVINRVYHLDRGYTHLVTKLAECGAKITRIRVTSQPSVATGFEAKYHEQPDTYAIPQ